MNKSNVAAALAVLSLALAACGDVSSTGSSDTGAAGGADGETTAAQSGPADIGTTLNTGKADVTASNFRDNGADVFGDNNVCVDVNIVNTSDSDTVTLNGIADWKLTDPNGVISDMNFTEATDYDAVELAPGGTKDGTVCFKSDATPGEYTLQFKEGLSFGGDAVEWKATL